MPRFRCLHCGRTFSRQSFAATYYLKEPRLLHQVAAGLVAGSAHRQLARSLRCAPSTVTRLSARIGRHCLLFMREALRQLPPPAEPIVLDHFETFVGSQLDRLGVATAVGHRSWFVYGLEAAPHRGSPRRSARKPAVRRPLPPRVTGSVVRSVRTILDGLIADDSGLDLISDDHPAYRAALAGHPQRARIRHVAHANPRRGPGADLVAARARDEAMFPVDQLHRLLRHSQAHHRRETIAFGRRSNALMERTALAAVWRNFVKGRSERRADEPTPAMSLGIARRRFDWHEIFARRLFPERTTLSASWKTIYRRELITPAVGRNQRHELAHAY